MSRTDELPQADLDFELEDKAKTIIRKLESELARKDARIAELEARLHQTERKLDQVRRGRDAAIARAEKAKHERDVLAQKSWEHERESAHARVELEISRRARDEARRHATIGVPGPHHLKSDALKRARIVANRYWPGTGAHLFPEESTE